MTLYIEWSRVNGFQYILSPILVFQHATLSIGPGDKAMVVFITSNLAIKHRQRAIANTR